MTNNKHLGTSLRGLLSEEGTEEAIDAIARERVQIFAEERLRELANKGQAWLETATDEQLKSFRE